MRKIIVFLFILAFLFCFKTASALAGDFSVTSISSNPNQPVKGQAAVITASIKYTGEDVITDQDLVDSYSKSFINFNLSTTDLPEVGPSNPVSDGSTFTFVFTGEFDKEGPARLYFRFSPHSSLNDSNSSNNAKEKNVTVIKQYDLSVSSFESLPLNPAIGQDIDIIVKVKNSGHVDLYTNFGITSYSLSGEGFNIKNSEIPRIDSSNSLLIGGEAEFNFTGYYNEVGDHLLGFTVDKSDYFDEVNEDNNILEKTISVAAGDDLDYEATEIKASTDADELLLGQSFTINATVKNNAGFTVTDSDGLLAQNYNYTSGGDYELVFPVFEISEISQSMVPSEEDPWEPGESISYTITGTIDSIGEGEIEFIIDSDNLANEINEDNNRALLAYKVYADQDALDDYEISDIKENFYTKTSVEISWLTSRPASGYVMIRDEDTSIYDWFKINMEWEEWPGESKAQSELHKVRIDGLEAGTNYRYMIITKRGNIEKESELRQFAAPSSNAFNIVSGPSYSVIDEYNDLGFSWQTDMYANTVLYYKLKQKDAYAEKKSTALSIEHNYELMNLADGEYDYYVRSENEAGEYVESMKFAFTVGSPAQKEPDIEAEPAEETHDNSGKETVSTAPAVGISANGENIYNAGMYGNLKGKIILTVEQNGEAYYVHPQKEKYYYLGLPADAFSVMREQGVGISNADLYKFAVGILDGDKADGDKDGLSNELENALGLDSAKADTDGDGLDDKKELDIGYSPWGSGMQALDPIFAARHNGKIFIQTEKNGEAWYINPSDNKRYFLGRPADAFAVMRGLGLGISNSNFSSL